MAVIVYLKAFRSLNIRRVDLQRDEKRVFTRDRSDTCRFGNALCRRFAVENVSNRPKASFARPTKANIERRERIQWPTLGRDNRPLKDRTRFQAR